MKDRFRLRSPLQSYLGPSSSLTPFPKYHMPQAPPSDLASQSPGIFREEPPALLVVSFPIGQRTAPFLISPTGPLSFLRNMLLLVVFVIGRPPPDPFFPHSFLSSHACVAVIFGQFLDLIYFLLIFETSGNHAPFSLILLIQSPPPLPSSESRDFSSILQKFSSTSRGRPASSFPPPRWTPLLLRGFTLG